MNRGGEPLLGGLSDRVGSLAENEKISLGRIRLPALWAAMTSKMFHSTSLSAAFLGCGCCRYGVKSVALIKRRNSSGVEEDEASPQLQFLGFL